LGLAISLPYHAMLCPPPRRTTVRGFCRLKTIPLFTLERISVYFTDSFYRLIFAIAPLGMQYRRIFEPAN